MRDRASRDEPTTFVYLSQIAEKLVAYAANDKTVLNAFPQFNASDVLAQARESTARYAAGAPLGE